MPILLRISLNSLAQASLRITADQISLLGATFLSSMDAFSVPSPIESASSVVYLSQRHLQKLNSLLQVFLQTPPPSSDTLSSTLASIAGTCVSFLDFADELVNRLAWNALALLMNIDFDVILGMIEILHPRLQHATPEFLKVAVTTNFKLRTGLEFLKDWTNLLQYSEPDRTALQHPEIITLYITCWIF